MDLIVAKNPYAAEVANKAARNFKRLPTVAIGTQLDRLSARFPTLRTDRVSRARTTSHKELGYDGWTDVIILKLSAFARLSSLTDPWETGYAACVDEAFRLLATIRATKEGEDDLTLAQKITNHLFVPLDSDHVRLYRQAAERWLEEETKDDGDVMLLSVNGNKYPGWSGRNARWQAFAYRLLPFGAYYQCMLDLALEEMVPFSLLTPTWQDKDDAYSEGWANCPADQVLEIDGTWSRHTCIVAHSDRVFLNSAPVRQDSMTSNTFVAMPR